MCLLSCNPDPTQTEKASLQILHGATRKSSAVAWLPRPLPSLYRTEDRFGRSNERKAFIVRRLMWLCVPRNGKSRKGQRPISAM
jgi:hypothetical protein